MSTDIQQAKEKFEDEEASLKSQNQNNSKTLQKISAQMRVCIFMVSCFNFLTEVTKSPIQSNSPFELQSVSIDSQLSFLSIRFDLHN